MPAVAGPEAGLPGRRREFLPTTEAREDVPGRTALGLVAAGRSVPSPTLRVSAARNADRSPLASLPPSADLSDSQDDLSSDGSFQIPATANQPHFRTGTSQGFARRFIQPAAMTRGP